jgi:ABC-2 type transport system permease protein
MAGVNPIDRNTGQLRLIAGLRWRMFVNSLRTQKAKFDLAARVLSGSSIGVGVLLLGLAMGIGAWAAFHQGRPFIFGAELWFVFVVWQFLPIFVLGFGAQADLGILLRFPLSYPTFVLLTLAYGLLDPVGIAALYWLLMILAGVSIAAPGAFLWAILALAVFAAVNLILSRSVFAWLDRWLAQRRTREILGVVFFVLIMSFQFIRPAAQHWGKRAFFTIQHLGPVARVFPPGLAASAIEAARRGQNGPAMVALGGLAGLGLLLAWVLGVRLRAQYRGENLGEAPRPRSPSARPTVREGWKLAGLSPLIAALLEKDLRYFLRNTAQYFALAIPVILVFVFGLQSGGSHGFRAMPMVGGMFFFPAGVAYCLFVTILPAYNSLGFDGPGVAMLFAAPIRFRDVLIAKNLLYTLLFAVEVAAVYVSVSLVRARPDPTIVAVTLAAALFAVPMNFAAGNLVSLHFPRQLHFGTMRRQKASGMTALISISIQLSVIGIAALVCATGRWVGKMWLAGAVFLLLAVAAFVVYRRTLEATSIIAAKHREALMSELCRSTQ